MPFFNPLKVSLVAAAGLAMVPVAGLAQTPAPGATIAADGPTYADLATLSDSAELVIRAKIRRQTTLKPDRAPGLAPGFARLYIQADTIALIAFVGGGIVPRLGEWFARSPFRMRFEAKGRFSDYLADIPTYVIDAPYPALLGAALGGLFLRRRRLSATRR